MSFQVLPELSCWKAIDLVITRDIISNCFLLALSWKGKGKWNSTFQCSPPSFILLHSCSELLGMNWADGGEAALCCNVWAEWGEVPSLGLLVFVLLLVYPLCLLIKDGIFFFLKEGKNPSLDCLYKHWQSSLYGRRQTKAVSTRFYLGNVSVQLVLKL